MANPATDKWVLVTGGTGFVGVFCILQLLQKGYKVKTTLRSLKRKEEVLEMLKNGGMEPGENLLFFQADLTKDENWDSAVQDCEYVLHVASPIFLKIPKDENEMIVPAVEGTLRVLRAAKKANVKRVVLTSSFGAVGYSHEDDSRPITEEDWTNPDDKHLSAYLKSKTLAEQAAWDFINKQDGNLELAVINPVGIFGPSLGPDLSSGFELIKRMLEGSMKAIPKITFGIVDVRDVADLHFRAMTNPGAKGQRFLAIAGKTMTLPEIALLLKNNLGEAGKNISLKILPNWIVRIAALFSPMAKNIVPQLGRRKDASNQKARDILGWSPRPNEEALLASAGSILRFSNLSKRN